MTRPAEPCAGGEREDSGGGDGLITETATATVTATPREGRHLDALDATLIGALMSLTQRPAATPTRDTVLRIFDTGAVWDEIVPPVSADAQEGTTVVPVLDPSVQRERLAAALHRLAAVEIETDTTIHRVGAGSGEAGYDGIRRRVCLRLIDTWAMCEDEVAVRWSREAYAALMHHADPATTGKVEDARA